MDGRALAQACAHRAAFPAQLCQWARLARAWRQVMDHLGVRLGAAEIFRRPLDVHSAIPGESRAARRILRAAQTAKIESKAWTAFWALAQAAVVPVA